MALKNNQCPLRKQELAFGLLAGLVGRSTDKEKVVTCVANDTALRTTNTPIQSTTQDPFGDGPWQNDRLLDGIQTHKYQLSIYNIDYDAYNYSGDVRMFFSLTKDYISDYLLFHIKTLNILNVELFDRQNRSVYIKRQFSYTSKQYYVLQIQQEFQPDNYTLWVRFSGYTNIGNVGMYLSSYTEDGVRKQMISTKFEPTDARKAFPCFDEPNLKAEYDLTIEHPLNTYALSNFPVKSSASNSSFYIQTQFQTTFKMSTYLIAWAVVPNDFSFKETKSEKGKQIRVYARKNAVDSGLIEFAVEITKKALDFFENVYFEISDAVPPKIDMIAVPDFPSGAMEHWGLVGFRETRLLYSDKSNSVASKQAVASTIVHELAHFWFGNLVTCAWWNDLWVNEAMADFLAKKGLTYLFPDWKIDEQTIIDEIVPVMWDDGFPSSHPIEANVRTPDQINTLFDSITYDKGGAVLRMLESVVGEIEFRDGLRRYLNANAFGPGRAVDFFSGLKLPNDMKARTTPVDFMDTWLKQMNYPQIYVALKRNNEATTVLFQQSRFLYSNSVNEINPKYTSPYNYTWEIYLQCKAGGTFNENSNDQSQHLQGDVKSFTFFLNRTIDGSYKLDDRQYTWVKCNTDFKSFYTTSYSEDILSALNFLLQNNNQPFSIGDRSDLIHTAFQLAYTSAKSYATSVSASSYLNEFEKDYVPWMTFVYHIRRINVLLQHRTSFKQLSDFGLNVVGRFVGSLNIWNDGGAHLDQLLKSGLVDFVCQLQNSECLAKATEKFRAIPKDYFTTPNSAINNVSPNIRSIVYKYHMSSTADYAEWSSLKNVYVETVDPQEQAYVLNALAYNRVTWILNSYLDDILLMNSTIREQDFFTVLYAVSRNPSGRYLAWYFLRKNWETLVRKFGIQNRTFGRSIITLTETFSEQYLYDEMVDFFNKNPNAGAGETPRAQALDIVKNNIAWVNHQEPDLLNILKASM